MKFSARPSLIAALALAALLFVTTNVWATNHTPPPTTQTPEAEAVAAASSAAVAGAVSVSKGGKASSKATGGKAAAIAAGGAGGKGGAANASQGQLQEASSNQEQSQTSDNDQQLALTQEYRQVRQVQTAIAGNGLGSTADCLKAGGAGAQGATFGLSFGGSKKDHDCSRYILANNLYARGQKQAGDRVFCQITEVKQALGEDCIALINEVVSVKAEHPAGERERRQERAGFDKVNK